MLKKSLPTASTFAEDSGKSLVILFPGEWALNYFTEKNPDVQLSELPWTRQ